MDSPHPPGLARTLDVAISATGCLLSAVIRDDSGTILSITVKKGMATLPKLAEAHAVCQNLQEAKSRFLHCCDKLNDWGIVHISRKCIYMAHNIAKWATNSSVVGCINPEAVDGSVLDDLTEWDPGDR
uniref:RNase H type-1 domain-containing protein n=1 Tax=Cannabis sativa TaxID=3483 RepID=A0A803NLG5_CANSA